MADPGRSCLLVPAGGAGHGMGHLVRCVALSRKLGRHVTFLTTHLDRPAKLLLRKLISRRDGGTTASVLARLPAGRTWELIVVDARATSAAEWEQLSRHGLVAGLDEGGPARELASFIVDTLPGPPGRSPANLSGPSFLYLPRRRRFSAPSRPRRILVSLGGEDREGLAARLVPAMLRQGICLPGHLTVVPGPLSGAPAWPAGVSVLPDVPRLSALLPRYDLLITHFGMTAFEALATGIPVILLNPTRYHETLGKAAGFPMIGVGTPNMDALKNLLSSPAGLYSPVERFHRNLGGAHTRGLHPALRGLRRIGSAACPVCGRGGNRVIARFSDRTYRRCASCGTIGLESFSGARRRYDSAYFSSEYKAQYGRTYLQDFDAIQSACRPRADIVRTLLGPGGRGQVLDVGCAYGPFLAAARDAGLSGFGLDVSAGAAAYVRRKLGIPCVHAGFESVDPRRLPREIRAVTMWYVIEHFPRTGEILARASALLPPGGVFAFSTPNGRGVSARKDLASFLRQSPGDHFSVLSPRGLGRILAAHGLALRRVRVTGHHPERFPGALGAAARRWPWAARLLRAASVALRLGDTFEAYAVKRGS